MLKVIAIVTALSLTACATRTGAHYNPVVDRPGPNYAVDLEECQAHSRKVLSAAEAGAGGALAGALLGAIFMAAVGGNNRERQIGAITGAFSGGLSAAADAEGGQRGIITRCLSGRGYSVLQ